MRDQARVLGRVIPVEGRGFGIVWKAVTVIVALWLIVWLLGISGINF